MNGFEIEKLIQIEDYGQTTNLIELMTCVVCQYAIARNPCSCKSFHVFCKDCMLQLDKCPLCRQQFFENSNNQKHQEKNIEQYRNMMARNIIASQFKIKCHYFEEGCKQQLPCDDELVTKHESQCEFISVICKNIGCGKKILKAQEFQHTENECEFKIVDCDECKMYQQTNYKYSKTGLKEHHSVCYFQLIQCVDCKLEFPQIIFSEHQNECTEKLVECEVCKQQIKKSMLETHDKLKCYQGDSKPLLDILNQKIQALQSENANLQNQFSNQQNIFQSSLKKDLSELKNNFQQDFQKFKIEMIKNTINPMKESPKEPLNYNNNNNNNNSSQNQKEFAELNKQIKNFQGELSKVSKDQHSFSDQLKTMKSSLQHFLQSQIQQNIFVALGDNNREITIITPQIFRGNSQYYRQFISSKADIQHGQNELQIQFLNMGSKRGLAVGVVEVSKIENIKSISECDSPWKHLFSNQGKVVNQIDIQKNSNNFFNFNIFEDSCMDSEILEGSIVICHLDIDKNIFTIVSPKALKIFQCTDFKFQGKKWKFVIQWMNSDETIHVSGKQF